MSDYFRRFERTLQKLNNNYSKLGVIIYRQDKQIQYLEIKAMHQAMFYIAFQFVIFLFTFIPSSSTLLCRNWWKPFSLSFITAVVFGLHFISTTMKYVRLRYAQDMNIIDQDENYSLMVSLEEHGEHVEENLCCQESMTIVLGQDQKKQQKPDMFAVYQRYAYLGVTYSLLLAFTVVVLHACRSPACDP